MNKEVNPAFAGIAIVCASLFAILWLAVAHSPGPLFFDRPVATSVQAAWPPFLSPFDHLLSWLGGAAEAVAGVLFIIFAIAVVRRATWLIIVSAAYAVIYQAINIIDHRPRPTGLPHVLHNVGAYSFPSGHTAFVIWVCTLTLILFARRLRRPWFVAAWALAVAAVLLAGLSRIAVGAHWPSDVVGGILLGIGWMSFTLSIRRLTFPVFGDVPPTRFLFHANKRVRQ